MIATKKCEHTGVTMYQCPNCGYWDYDALNEDQECRICWEFENHPETFELSQEQLDDWNKSADYIMKHKITANVDFPLND